MRIEPEFLMIDVFCGAGGTTTGAVASGVCKVIAAINHSPLAISSHAANHKDVFHITEDILTADLSELLRVVNYWRSVYPNAKLCLWASLECTNFSDAKGGLPRDADSRALADGMFRYLELLRPEYFLIENVEEFMAWGPLTPKIERSGMSEYCVLHLNSENRLCPHWIPESRTAGKDYVRWVKQVQEMGYEHDWNLLCAADYGGVTIRERYFGAFFLPGLPFHWPQRTHAKRPSNGTLFQDELKQWRPVAEVLDFTDLGRSIFDRKKPLVDKTLRRILAGLRKFHSDPQIMVCNSPGYCTPVSDPIGTLTTKNSKALLIPILQSYYGNTKCLSSISAPSPTLRTKEHLSLVSPWIDRDFRTGRYQSIKEPAGTLLTTPKMNLCSAFLVNPQFRSKGSSVFSPSPTVIASQKSYPLSLATATNEGSPRWEYTDSDSDVMRELKDFMRENGISDIFMRMLKIVELKRIQGFPDDYILHGNGVEQKKFIGNSVETGVVKAWLRAMAKV